MRVKGLSRSEAIEWLKSACEREAEANNADATRRPVITFPRDTVRIDDVFTGKMSVMGVEAHGGRVAGSYLCAEAAVNVLTERYPGQPMELSSGEDALLIKDAAQGVAIVALRPAVIGATWAEMPVVEIMRRRPNIPTDTLRRIGNLTAEQQRDVLEVLCID